MLTAPEKEIPLKTQRWIAKLETDITKPSLVLFGGIHGNELTGIEAIERVLATIKDKNVPVLGNIYALRGNLKAIENGERFLDHDLNRLWTEEKINAAKQRVLLLKESDELVEIHNICESLIYTNTAEVTFLDLHTTSSDSSPFFVLSDTLRNRNLARSVPATMVLGLLEQLQGTLSGYLGNYGATAIVFEAGQHFASSSVDRHVAAIWLLLDKLQIIDSSSLDLEPYQKLLKEASKGNPTVVESKLRFGIEADDEFQMEPGFKNFSKVQKGQLLATFNGTSIYSEHTGRIFMPLYQKKGDDGFFLTRRISPFWLGVSKWLRRRNAHRFITLLPGVKLHPEQENTFIVNQTIASVKTMQVLHLFGFRKERKQGKILLVSRRAFDLKGPWD